MAVNKSTPSVNQFSSAQPGSSFSQRTFLGSSVSKFTLSAGFGDTSSTLGINLIDDPINKADGTTKGTGQDPYHNSFAGDKFSPPPVGSPVFFAMGPSYNDDNFVPSLTSYPNLPTTEESFTKTMDDLYGTNTIQPTGVGYYDLAFGGLLQTYNQTRGNNGNPVYTAKIIDPREVLSNVELILRNYAGTTMDNANMFNLYGFLEYNGVAIDVDGYAEDILERKPKTNENGEEVPGVEYSGTDMRYSGDKPTYVQSLQWSDADGNLPTKFPITGTGMSRVGPRGIPYYRVVQAMNALAGLYGPLPAEYADAGFGGTINFRGFNYLVDLSAVPIIGQFYYFDYDKITLMDFCQEVCEITSSELFVSLLPIIDHPATKNFFEYNKTVSGDPSKMIHGIIKVSTLNRQESQTPNAIKSYIDNNLDGIATRTDVGVELSNVTTDKFIAGGQEIENVFFTTVDDRKEEDEQISWKLKTSLKQQLLPYYGKLKSGAVTIPKGNGAYQQILLDASDLNLPGVGQYYVATEIELRAATISFEVWAAFLTDYNELYMESTEENDRVEGPSLDRTPNVDGLEGVRISNNYAVTVPRCLWAREENEFGENELPVDVCHPPYGYPLYYKRAYGIGLTSSGLAGMGQSFLSVTSSIAEISNATTKAEFITILRSEWAEIQDASKDWNQNTTTVEKEYFKVLENAVKQVLANPSAIVKADVIGLLHEFGSRLEKPQQVVSKAGIKGVTNAQRIYKFIKDIANKHLGKMFLVKIPQAVNWDWQPKGNEYGFKPRSLNNDPRVDPPYPNETNMGLDNRPIPAADDFTRYLYAQPTNTQAAGALVTNLNPITNERVFNYKPNSAGGYWNSELTASDTSNDLSDSPLIEYGLAPKILDPIMKKNGRTGCYVKFFGSQNLSFDRIPRNKFNQQILKINADGDVVGSIPDVNYRLDNVAGGSVLDLRPEDGEKEKATAFVAAEVSNEILFAPVVEDKLLSVYGQEVHDIAKWSKPKRIFNCETGKIETSIPYLTSDLRPLKSAGTREIVDVLIDGSAGDDSVLDTDHAYVIITIPNKVEPTVDSRFRDGPKQAFNTWRIKHTCNQDVVRGIPGFDVPGFKDESTNIVSQYNLDPLPLTMNRAIARAKDGLTYSKANEICYVAPSPVYPDIICIPLESTERCYGPWLSSLTNGSYQNIGGNIEYEKDESLAPWNYSGYDLMNQAAQVKIQYSNSLLLQSERGSFSIPSAPTGIALASFLGGNGPLVTSINVTIGSAGVETAYVMDMYTSSFGKLQKQKSDNISKIGRDRQKQIDQKNVQLRYDLGKSQIDNNRQEIEERIRSFSVEDSGVELSPGFETTNDGVDTTVLTVQEREQEAALIQDDEADSGTTVDSVYRSYTVSGSTVASSDTGNTASLMPEKTAARDFGNSADKNVKDDQIVTTTPKGKSLTGTGNKAQSMDDLYDDGFTPTSSWG
jgi:hypothetical protein